MTWKLRVYGTDGNEIGWLTEDPHEYQITGPENATDKTIRHIKGVFSRSEDRVEKDLTPDPFGGTEITFIFIESTGEEFLEHVKKRLNGRTPETPLDMTIADE